MTVNFHLCRICRFDCSPFFPWGEDGESASYAFCPECGVEFGYEDSNEVALKIYRKKYLASKKEKITQSVISRSIGVCVGETDLDMISDKKLMRNRTLSDDS